MRVQVNLSEQMCFDVDKYAKMMGVSRSALCSMLIGQGIMSYNKSMEVFDGLAEKVSAQAEALMNQEV